MGVSLHRPHIPGAEILNQSFKLFVFSSRLIVLQTFFLFLGINNSVIITFLNLLFDSLFPGKYKGITQFPQTILSRLLQCQPKCFWSDRFVLFT